MNAEQPTIIYTLTDEAPLLATYAHGGKTQIRP